MKLDKINATRHHNENLLANSSRDGKDNPSVVPSLGIDVDQFGLADPANGWGLAFLYGRVAIELASRVVPGFQEKPRGKHPREIIRAIRIGVDRLNLQGKSDLDACRDYLKFEQPDLAKARNRTDFDKKARSLANRISNDRQNAKKEEKKSSSNPMSSMPGGK